MEDGRQGCERRQSVRAGGETEEALPASLQGPAGDIAERVLRRDRLQPPLRHERAAGSGAAPAADASRPPTHLRHRLHRCGPTALGSHLLRLRREASAVRRGAGRHPGASPAAGSVGRGPGPAGGRQSFDLRAPSPPAPSRASRPATDTGRTSGGGAAPRDPRSGRRLEEARPTRVRRGRPGLALRSLRAR